MAAQTLAHRIPAEIPCDLDDPRSLPGALAIKTMKDRKSVNGSKKKRNAKKKAEQKQN